MAVITSTQAMIVRVLEDMK